LKKERRFDLEMWFWTPKEIISITVVSGELIYQYQFTLDQIKRVGVLIKEKTFILQTSKKFIKLRYVENEGMKEEKMEKDAAINGHVHMDSKWSVETFYRN
jgi:hypothetical protein